MSEFNPAGKPLDVTKAIVTVTLDLTRAIGRGSSTSDMVRGQALTQQQIDACTEGRECFAGWNVLGAIREDGHIYADASVEGFPGVLVSYSFGPSGLPSVDTFEQAERTAGIVGATPFERIVPTGQDGNTYSFDVVIDPRDEPQQ